MPQKELNYSFTVRCQQYNLKPNEEENAIFSEYGIKSIDEITYWASVDIDGEKYTSTIYKVTKSIDYFAEFANLEMGKIKYYIKCKSTIYAVVEIFSSVKIKHHMYEVISNHSISIFKIEEITEKLIYIQIGAKEIVYHVPNSYEKT